MTEAQLYLAIGVPIVVNITALGIVATLLMNHINAMATSLRAEFSSRFASIENRITRLEDEVHLVTGKVIQIDNRLTRLEERLTK